ncbi:MAG: dihydrodipicolinate synthase family protein [bacterium]|nr:dihydrodipicolinate synthase family protein [bacterium]
MKTDIAGILAPIATPFDDREELDIPRLKENLARWSATRLTGVVVLGSNGENVLLDADERERLIAVVRENFPPDRRVLAGTGSESTRETIRLTRRAAECGADAALVLNPSHYKGAMTGEALRGFYLDVAEASPIPIILYNMPRNTGVDLPASLIIGLSSHPNIVGVKDSGGNIVQIAETIGCAAPGFAVFAGSAGFLLPTVLLGGVGGILALANVVPDRCFEILSLVQAGRLEEARLLQVRLIPLNGAVTTRWGVAGLKAALDLTGYYGGRPRRPLVPLGDQEREQLRGMLEKVGALTG